MHVSHPPILLSDRIKRLIMNYNYLLVWFNLIKTRVFEHDFLLQTLNQLCVRTSAIGVYKIKESFFFYFVFFIFFVFFCVILPRFFVSPLLIIIFFGIWLRRLIILSCHWVVLRLIGVRDFSLCLIWLLIFNLFLFYGLPLNL